MLINKTEPLADHTIEEHSESPYGDHKQYTPHTRAGEYQVEIRRCPDTMAPSALHATLRPAPALTL